MGILKAYPENKEQAKALKSFLNALAIPFETTSENSNAAESETKNQ